MADQPGREIRLQKVLASAGVGSRRSCEDLIANGHVEVDGSIVTDLGTRVDPESVVIRVDGERLPVAAEVVYIAVNKPRGVVSTMADEQGRRDLLRSSATVPSGCSTSVVSTLTRPGCCCSPTTVSSRIAWRTRPSRCRRRMSRWCAVWSTVDRRAADQWRRARRRTSARGRGPAILDRYEQRSSVEITLHEGRNRIVRRMFDAVGHPVEQLSRTSIGPVRLGGLKPGDTRELGRSELGALLERLGL